MFIILLKYVVPLKKIDEYMEPHRQFLEAQYSAGKFLASGPMEPRTGGAILANLDDRDEAERLIKEDPFYQERIAEYEIIQFHATLSDKRLENILSIRS